MGDIIGGKDRDAEQQQALEEQRKLTSEAKERERKLKRRETEERKRLNRERIASLRGRFSGGGGAQVDDDSASLFSQITGK